MNLEQALQTFIVESRELLQDFEDALLVVAHSDEKAELINAIFRTAHTIKGSAGLFGLDHIVGFTHVAESVLDRVRDGKLPLSDELVKLMLSCGDHIGTQIDSLANGNMDDDEAAVQQGALLAEQLRGYLAAQPKQPDLAVPAIQQAAHATESLDEGFGANHWHISLRFGVDVLRNGMDPLSFLRYLGKLGEIAHIVTLFDALPSIEEMDPESCYLGFEIAFRSDADKATIEDVFAFVRDDCGIRILPPRSHVSEYIRLIQEPPEESARLGEILIRCDTVTPYEVNAALIAQSAQLEAATKQPIGAILEEQGSVRPAVVEAALEKQKQINQSKVQEGRSIRVDADKLDQLIMQVGELIIAGASVNLLAQNSAIVELQERAATLSSLVESVRDSALQLRMVKIGDTFNRFRRVVHDVSAESGKDIQLIISGEDAELDKTVVERIADPITHLVRNAIDHGIEPAEQRVSNGKSAQGTVRLNAYQDSGAIVIEVSDDGGGLKRDRILAKAIERGLVEPGHDLADNDIYDLVFEPGFSTADKITNLSGRGVGMDVVKRNIIELRGTVAIASEEGVGTTITVRLPLTLAIIDGFLVEIGTSAFVIPLDLIEECVEFSTENGREYTDLRGRLLPFIHLRELFDAGAMIGRRQSIVVIRHGGRTAGLVVDSLLGEFQTVIKPLGKLFSGVKCISGSTMLGSGKVALILDIPALIEQTVRASSVTRNQVGHAAVAA